MSAIRRMSLRLGSAVSDELPSGVIDVFPINLKQGQLGAHLSRWLEITRSKRRCADRLAQTSRTFDF
jgi:hypothetical protein